jgi:hypothetical protein
LYPFDAENHAVHVKKVARHFDQFLPSVPLVEQIGFISFVKWLGHKWVEELEGPKIPQNQSLRALLNQKEK